MNRKWILALFVIGISPQLFNGFYLPWMVRHQTVFWLTDTMTMVVMPLTIFLVGRRARWFSAKDLGWNLPRDGGAIVLSLIGVALMPLLFFKGIQYFRRQAMYLGLNQGLDYFNWGMMLMEPSNQVAKGIYMALTAGVVEEFYYRALLRLVFNDETWQKAAYVITSSLVFGIIHWEQGEAMIFSTAVVGLITALFYLRAKTIWPLIIGHCVADLIIFT